MTRNRQVTIVALVGSIMVAVGSLLPWVEIRTGLGGVTANGTEGDGVFTLIVGALMSVVAFLAMENPTGVKQRSIFTGGIVAALIAGFHVLQRGSVTILETTIPAIVGIGVWIVLVGAVVATGAATQMLIQPEPTQVRDRADHGRSLALNDTIVRRFFIVLAAVGTFLIVVSVVRQIAGH
jgi:lysylphosphatidylglycerol synthetase-like protein (DUF2156 family)